jgi:uracil-DNA glycosylase family 4
MQDNGLPSDRLAALAADIVSCEACPRLRLYCRQVAEHRRRAYRDQTYWGLPVPGFGDPAAQLFILGLAPGAHGANRTGRVFTGDASGDLLYDVLHEVGFASQNTSVHRDDGLRLINTWISCSVRCAPPKNKPRPEEVAACRHYLERELDLLPNVRVIVALGRLAFENALAVMKRRGTKPDGKQRFAHGAVIPTQPLLMASYHPSQQNTFTGRLTRRMLVEIFHQARAALLTERASAQFTAQSL